MFLAHQLNSTEDHTTME